MEITYHLEKYTGPLDLLLSLIAKNKVDILDIPIALILEQYLEYLDKMQEFDMVIASEFIEMASQLTYIKSKMLLPKYKDEEDEDPRQTLVESLLEYQKIKEVGLELALMEQDGSDIFVKEQEILEKDKSFNGMLEIDILVKAIKNMLEKEQIENIPSISSFSKIIGGETISVQTKIQHIILLLKKNSRLSFTKVFLGCQNRSDIVATFLALLELIKSAQITIEENQSDYVISVKTFEVEDNING